MVSRFLQSWTKKEYFFTPFSLPFASQAQQSILTNIDKDDGSDALVNAILVARGDALPTQFDGKITNRLYNLIYCCRGNW